MGVGCFTSSNHTHTHTQTPDQHPRAHTAVTGAVPVAGVAAADAGNPSPRVDDAVATPSRASGAGASGASAGDAHESKSARGGRRDSDPRARGADSSAAPAALLSPTMSHSARTASSFSTLCGCGPGPPARGRTTTDGTKTKTKTKTKMY